MGPQAARSMVFMPAVRVDTDWNSAAITLPGTDSPPMLAGFVPLHQADERRAADPQDAAEKASTTFGMEGQAALFATLADLHPDHKAQTACHDQEHDRRPVHNNC